MEEILYNLIYNASLYTPLQSLIRIDVNRVEEKLVIIIEDNGSGFPEDEIEKVFEKFYRLKNTGIGGTGLGLSIVKGFVEAHNGSVKLKNLQTGGARFEIYLPSEVLELKPIEI